MDAERTKRRGAAAACAWLRMASRPETTAREREADGFWMRIWLWLHSALHCNALMQAVVEQSSSLDDFWGLHALDWECPRPGWGETLVQMAAKRPSRVHTKWSPTGSSVDTPLMVIAPEAGHKYRILCEMGCVPPNWPRPAPISRPYDR